MFINREQAGKLLAGKIKGENISRDSFVIAIPRGGAVIGDIVARELGLPLSIIIIKKIGAPYNPELAIGAVGPDHTVFWDERLIKVLSINEKERKDLLRQKEKEREDKEKLLDVPQLDLTKKSVIVVDDGVATGSTVIAASLFLKKKATLQIVLAVPVIANDTLMIVKKYFDKVVYLESPTHFYAVGEFYEEFPEVEDTQVIEILRKAEEYRNKK